MTPVGVCQVVMLEWAHPKNSGDLYRIRTHLKCGVITIFAYIGYLTNCNINLTKSAFSGIIIYVLQILHFVTQIALQFVLAASAAAVCYLQRAYRMSDKRLLYADRTVFLTSSPLKCAVYKTNMQVDMLVDSYNDKIEVGPNSTLQ